MRPRFHRDLFETILMDAANDNPPRCGLPLAPSVAERCYVADDLLERLADCLRRPQRGTV